MTTNNSSFAATYGGNLQFGAGDASLSKVAELLKTSLTNINGENHKYTVIQVPTAITGSYGAVALCQLERGALTPESAQAPFVTYHLLMVEHANAQTLEKYSNSVNGSEYQLDITVGEYFTTEYRNSVQQVIEARFGKGATYTPAGYQIVYRETQLDDADRIRPMAEEAMRALAASSPLLPNTVFNLNSVSGSEMLHSVTSLDESIREANGLPIRADITLRLAIKRNSESKLPTATTIVNQISETSAYVELVHVGQQQGFGGFGGMGMANIPKMLIPRIVISNALVYLPVAALQFSLLSIGSLMSQMTNRAYGVVWSPRYGQTDNYRDIGAVGYLAPFLREDGQPGMLDIRENVQVQQILNTLVTEGMLYSMDIRQGGSGNWCNDIYLRAAGNDEISRVANEEILRTANILTDGRFAKIFKGSRAVANSVVTNPTGHCTVGNEQVDIANLDLLAILNIFGSKDMSVVNRFFDIEYNPNYDVNGRVMRRVRLLGLTCKAFTVKGYSARITFTGEFAQALTQAIAGCGVNFSTNAFGSQTDQVLSQNIDMFSNLLVTPSSLGNFYNRTMNVNQNPNGFTVGQGGTFY